MKRGPRTIMITLGRSLKLRCPVCGRASIVQRPFNLKHRCDSCGVIFKREEGFFIGAIMANVVATEVFILIIYFALLLLTTLSDRTTFIILFTVAVAFPLTFYHRSEEHTSELQSQSNLVCRLLLEKKKKKTY